MAECDGGRRILAHFEARYLTPEEHDEPALLLSVRAHAHSRESVSVKLTRRIPLSDASSDRIPAYYQFEDAQPAIPGNPRATPPVSSRAAINPKLTIVAAPGVSVEVIGIDNFTRPRPSDPLIDIYRVQDPGLVPYIGWPFSRARLLEPYFINTSPPSSVGPTPISGSPESSTNAFFDSRISTSELIERYNSWPATHHWYQVTQLHPGDLFDELLNEFGQGWSFGSGDDEGSDEEPEARRMQALERAARTTVYLPPPSHIDVQRTHNGIRFHHSYSAQVLEITVDQNHLFTTPRSEQIDHLQRFAYSIEHNRENGMVTVNVVKSPNTTARIIRDIAFAFTSETRNQFLARSTSIFFSVHDTDFENIPPQGMPLPTTGLRQSALGHVSPEWVGYGQMMIDLMVSFIPVLGDAVDIAEFNNAMINGTDRWGRQLSGWEKALMGIGTVLTLVGPSIATLRQLPRLLGSNRRAVERVHSAIQAARFNREEVEFITAMSEHLQQGRRLADAQVTRLQELLRRVPRCTA